MVKSIYDLEIDYSLLDLEIDESKIESILAFLPEETRKSMTIEEKIQIVKNILNYDVTNLFDDVMCFVSKF